MERRDLLVAGYRRVHLMDHRFVDLRSSSTWASEAIECYSIGCIRVSLRTSGAVFGKDLGMALDARSQPRRVLTFALDGKASVPAYAPTAPLAAADPSYLLTPSANGGAGYGALWASPLVVSRRRGSSQGRRAAGAECRSFGTVRLATRVDPPTPSRTSGRHARRASER